MDNELIMEKLWSPERTQAFIWYAINEDGSKIFEYDLNNNSNRFDDLDKTKVKEFGFIGLGGKLFLNVENGVITLDGDRELNLSLFDRDKGDTIQITKNKDIDYHNFFEMKQLSCNFTFNSETNEISHGTDSYISAFIFGYSGSISYDNYKFKFKYNYTLDMVKGMNTANFGLKCNRKWIGDISLSCLANDFVKDSVCIYPNKKDYTWFSIII